MAVQQQQQQSSRVTPEDAFCLLYLVSDIHASAIATLIRRDFGREALAWNSFLAMFLVVFIWAGTADPFMGAYFGVWFFAQVMQRIRTFWLIRQGAVIHSRYPGFPYVAMQMPFVRRESTAKGFVEPMMCLLGGAMLCSVSVNLGGFIMCGFLSFMVRNGIEREILRKRVERIQDAEIEQRWVSDAYKYGMDD